MDSGVFIGIDHGRTTTAALLFGLEDFIETDLAFPSGALKAAGWRRSTREVCERAGS